MKEEYSVQLEKLKKIFGDKVSLDYFFPTGEEQENNMQEGYCYLINGVIVGNPDLGFEYNAKAIFEFLKKIASNDY